MQRAQNTVGPQKYEQLQSFSNKGICTSLLKQSSNDYWEKRTSFAYLFFSKPNLVSHLFQNKVILIFSVIGSTLCYSLYLTIIISCLMLHAKTDPKYVATF